MSASRRLLSLVLLAFLPVSAARAGLHYSGEEFAELPARWRGYLLDQRALRQVAVPPAAGLPPSALRTRYEQEAARLAKLPARTPDESADLGALYVRLGDVAKALDVLRPAQRANPRHYRLAANLGTAWQLGGDLRQAASCLEEAVRLSPGRLQKAEEVHLRLVRQRLREPAGAQGRDDLFGIDFVGPTGRFEPGRLAPEQRRKLPPGAVASAQLLGLWLPADPRLLWQLGELASCHGDVTTAAAVLDGCVTEFGLRGPELRDRRAALRAAADALAKAPEGGKKEHDDEHELIFKPRSARPLVTKGLLASLPAVDPRGVNALPWEVLAETTLARGEGRPKFAAYLKELEGSTVVLQGHMQPLGESGEAGAFLLVEHPVGCWYCETPDLTGIVLVEMPAGKAAASTRKGVTVTGKLTLNATDPENFLYTVREAKVRE